MVDTCPLIQSVAVASIVVGILIHLMISSVIKKYIHSQYLKEAEDSKLKSWLLDVPELLPSRALTKGGYALKLISIITLLIVIASGVYIEDKLCITTSYKLSW